ncbi:MAG: hypothetical protein EBU90_06805 [Proteobacteria bacterium]|jgi:hypothetical protein|nr:hypothetical protein [Pseudomonadota bacterium]NBP14043.1 hypothetical protein [bacterium]
MATPPRPFYRTINGKLTRPRYYLNSWPSPPSDPAIHTSLNNAFTPVDVAGTGVFLSNGQEQYSMFRINPPVVKDQNSMNYYAPQGRQKFNFRSQ